MLVVVVECAPDRLYGYLSSLSLQVAAGVYVANLPKNQREEIWNTIQEWATPHTRAVIVWGSGANEQGLEFRVIGKPQRRPIDREGLVVSTWLPKAGTPVAEDLTKKPPRV